jgi:MoxR-like ATPase
LSIPELGTIKAVHRPMVVLTSNRTRDVHDALKRRCIYHWIEYPSESVEIEIVARKVPALAEALRRRAVGFVQRLRREELSKVPGVAETVDWSEALTLLGATELTVESAEATLGVLLKSREDLALLRGGLTHAILKELR